MEDTEILIRKTGMYSLLFISCDAKLKGLRMTGKTVWKNPEDYSPAENVGVIDDVSGRAKLFLVLPDAFLDVFLILWTFTSLSKTLEQLQMKRTSVKLEIYRKSSNALAVLVVASVAWIVYEVHFKATDPFNERWQTA